MSPKLGKCYDCSKFVCELGQARCELCEYGHKAKHCGQRIDVSTYAEEAYIHGDCKVTDMGSTEFSFSEGSIKYTVSGDVTSVDRTSSYSAGPGRDALTIRMHGTIKQERVHSEPHFNTAGMKHRFCNCKCADCTETEAITKRCICPECDCQ